MGNIICAQCGYANAETCQTCGVCGIPFLAVQQTPARPHFANDPHGPTYAEIIPDKPPVLPTYQAPPSPVSLWSPPVIVSTSAANPQNFQTLAAYSPHPKLAGRGERLFAWLIDTLGFWAAFIIIGFVEDIAGPDNASDWVVLFTFASYVFMQIYLLTAHGQTLGKRALGLRIVKADTLDNGGFSTNVLMRTLAPMLIGGMTCHLFTLVDYLAIFGDECKCVHDNMAGTIVIKDAPNP